MDAIVNKYIDRIAYSTGFDVSDQSNKEHLKGIIEAGISDLQSSGVSMSIIQSDPLILTTLIIFVTDNLNMKPGEFKTSNMYISNMFKLRMKSHVQ